MAGTARASVTGRLADSIRRNETVRADMILVLEEVKKRHVINCRTMLTIMQSVMR